MNRTTGPNHLSPLYFFIFLTFMVIVNPLTGQLNTDRTWITLISSTPSNAETILQYSDIETSRVEVRVGGFWKEQIRNVEGMTEEKMFLDNTTPLLVKGAPDLDKLTLSLIIPDRARMQVFIIEEEYVDIPGIHIVPSKGNLTRDINPADVPYEYGREYQTDAFFPGVAAELRTPHIIRDVRGQVVVIYPFRYNPVQKMLRVYTRLVVEVKSVGDDGENVLTVRREEGKTVRAFEGIYARKFLNYNEYRSASRYVPVEEDGNMLVISYGAFMADMQDFTDWKNMSGIPTEMVNVSTIGTTASQIKTYVANYYNTNGLTYLLLVGDAAQVPSSSLSGGASDNDYGYIVGGDNYPDIFVGRFSAENTSHVQTQVLRTLNYEKMPDAAPGYYQRAMCIASAEGPGDDGEYDWQHQRNIRTRYMNYTYTYGAELYGGSQSGEDAPGDPTATMVASEINTGTGIISYTGHGGNTSWSTSGFNNTNINSLTNNSMLPFIISVACVNGNFVSTTCFAEAWLRATHNGQPSGAVATIMSTIDQSWNPPMRGQDEMVDILVETYPNNIKRTFGGICMNGCMNMNDEYGSDGYEMTDTWTIFGDPSLMVRTAAPAAMTVTFPGDLPVGSDQVTVNCDQEGARVAVSMNYQLLGSGIVSSGSANVLFGQINTEETLIVTVTAFNCLPVIDTVFITDLDMVFLSSTAFHGNLDEVAPGEQNAEALGVKVIMSGSQNPFDLLSLTFNMNGTTDLSDVTSLRVYYTGNNAAFSANNLFGTGTVSAGPVTITGTQTLTGGFNHFWLAYDIDPDATIGNAVDAECTGLIISDNDLLTRIPDITAPSGNRLINNGMVLTALTTTQSNTQSVAPGDQNVDIICVEITTSGSPLPLLVNSLKISTNGNTDLDDITAIKVYNTTSSTFSTNELFGTAAPGGEVVITGTKILSEGINYFWVAYDVAAGAGPGNHLDAGCSEVVFAGATGSQVPAVTHPAGYRQVELNYCIPTYTYGTGVGDYISLVQLGSLVKSSGASPSPFYTYYQDVTTPLVPGDTYDLIVSPGTYSSGNNIAAWIDFNRNGIFEPEEKLGEITDIPPLTDTTITFPVPSDATVGMVRLRVREVWNNTNLDPCNNYNYGETEDYNVHIMPPGCWLGYTNEWNNPANWSDGTVPGPDSHVIIPEILMGDHYPAVFTGGNPVIDLLELEPGSDLIIPDGTTIIIGNNR